MGYQITKEDVWWVGIIQDRPSALAEKLEIISKAGVSLDYMIARRSPDRPGTGVVFLAP